MSKRWKTGMEIDEHLFMTLLFQCLCLMTSESVGVHVFFQRVGSSSEWCWGSGSGCTLSISLLVEKYVGCLSLKKSRHEWMNEFWNVPEIEFYFTSISLYHFCYSSYIHMNRTLFSLLKLIGQNNSASHHRETTKVSVLKTLPCQKRKLQLLLFECEHWLHPKMLLKRLTENFTTSVIIHIS